jgi:hypothetical protein
MEKRFRCFGSMLAREKRGSLRQMDDRMPNHMPDLKLLNKEDDKSDEEMLPGIRCALEIVSV